MAQKVNLLGIWANVPGIFLPGENGQVYFADPSITTATEEDVFYGLRFLKADGSIGTGNWFGGLEYEAGEWEPASDIARGTVTFEESHQTPPTAVLLTDATGTAHSTTNSNYIFAFYDSQRHSGAGFPYSSSGFRYATAFYAYRGNSTSSISVSGLMCSNQTDSTGSSSTAYPKYWATATEFHPYSNSTSRYWRSNRRYKWIAVWSPPQ